MRHGGTDLLAVACIVGGGVIAGGVTLALANGSEVPSLECATTVGPNADVVASLGREGLVVVTPNVRVREVKECMEKGAVEEHAAADEVRAEERVRVRLAHQIERVDGREAQEAEREVERARREAEQVRREVERVRERVNRLGSQQEQRSAEMRERAAEARARAAEARDRAAEARDRAAERRARAGSEREQAAMERARAAQERAREGEGEGRQRERLDRMRMRLGDLDMNLDGGLFDGDFMEGFLEGFTIDLPQQSFQFRFEGLDPEDFEVTGPADRLRLELRVLEGLDLHLDGVDQETQDEVQRRLDEKVQELRERLERLGDGSGR